MSDHAAAPTRTERRGRIVRWVLPVVGSVALMFGGFWAVEFSQSGRGPTPAVNLVSVSLYGLMIVLYGGVSVVTRRWRQPTLPASERRFRAGGEALVVGFAGAPAIVLVILTRALYVGDLGQ